jgi:hypothetical protein
LAAIRSVSSDHACCQWITFRTTTGAARIDSAAYRDDTVAEGEISGDQGGLRCGITSASKKSPVTESVDRMNQPRDPEKERKDSSVFKMIERVSVTLGLLVLVPITRIWDKPWWMRALFAICAGALLAATTFDLLPRRTRRWPVALAFFVIPAVAAALGPAVFSGKHRPAPNTAGSATIVSPQNDQFIGLTVREASGYTDGFMASGRCTVPHGYRAVIVSLADDGSGYWLLSDGIIADCVDDGVAHQWTATKVDPSWSGMAPRRPVTIGVTVLRKDLAEQAQIQKVEGEPLKLPQPTASALIYVSRIQQP